MLLKKLKKSTSILLLLLISIPTTAFAYSDYIIPGGETIGIEIKATGVIIVGTYEINGKDPAKEAGLQVGDIIQKVNDKNITTIDELVQAISHNDSTVELTYLRDDKEYQATLPVTQEDGIYKTGLYVKDSITGIGTLSYIDPGTNLFGALGHEVIESNTGQMLEVKNGQILKSTVTNIERSENGSPGSKNAQLEFDQIKGQIAENTSSGIFGKYTDIIPSRKAYKVASVSDIKKGEAKILTVVDGEEIREYSINITKINKNDKNNKNLLFEITDPELLEKTGITYWLDGGWGVDVLAGRQTRTHRDIDIDFDAQYMEKLLDMLLYIGYKIDTDWKPVRIELYSDELGYLDIHPFVLNEDGTSKQTDLEGGWYEFEKDYFVYL